VAVRDGTNLGTDIVAFIRRVLIRRGSVSESNEAAQIMDLMTVFGRAIDGLQTIITAPNDANSVGSAIDSINLTRCWQRLA